MIKFLRRAVILLFVFVLGVAGSSFLLNSETTDDRSDMNDPVFPEVMVDFDGNYANRMYGYAQPMQSDFTRDSVTPIDTSKELSFVINAYDTKVKSLSYEIRTSDGSKVLENRKIKSLDKQDSYLITTIKLSSDLLMNQEYSLQLSLETNKGTAYYYTRVVSRSNVNAAQYVKFVASFYEKCLDKASAEDLTAYLESDTSSTSSPDDGKFSRIFSFRKETDGDFRDSRYQHNIKIIRVEDNGDVDFVLYGYMNRGVREGYCGVCVYHYSNDQNVVEEKVFIPSTESYEFLKEDLGTLSYVSTENALYLLFANKLYKINISDGTSEVLEEGIKIDDFAVSDTGAHAAWIIQEGESAGNIKEIDFETLETRSLAPSSGQSLVLNGFMNEDLVYGIVVDGDVIADDNGHETTGIHTVRIEGFDGTLKKEYHQDGLYVTDITMGNTMMEFQLSKKTKKGYKAVSKDNILNNSKASTNTVSVELVTNSRTGTQIRLALTETPEIQEPLVVYAKMKNIGDDRIILDTQIPEEDIYYVYAKGGLDSTFTDPALALQRADDQTGVVLNRAQQYVWERGNKKTKLTLNLEDVPEAMKSASLDVTALQEALGDEGTIIDLSGCTLDSVLYEVSAQRPVIAKTGDNTSVVIIGYDEYNTYLYDPQKGETYPYGMNDSTELFEKAGNIFISYVEKLKL